MVRAGLVSIVVALIALLSGCATEATEVLVVLDTNAPPDRGISVSVTAVRGSGGPADPIATLDVERAASAQPDAGMDGGTMLTRAPFPASFAITPRHDGPRDESVLLTLRATLTDSFTHDTISFRRLARFTFTPHRHTIVRAFLAIECASIVDGCASGSPCTVARRCEEQGQTCGDQGVCVPVDVTPDTDLDGGSRGPDAAVLPLAPRLALGRLHTCVVDATDAVWCWGDRAAGSCGDVVSATPTATPVRVIGLPPVRTISAAEAYACAVGRDDESVWCWGGNGSGVLASSVAESAMPLSIAGVPPSVRVAAAYQHACALTRTGDVWCWGEGSTGALGPDHVASRQPPSIVTGVSGAIEIAAGEGFTCALVAGGRVRCWGTNDAGQLGRSGTSAAMDPVPADVAGLTDAVSLRAGAFHACAVRANGALACWGSNYFNERGYTPSASDPHPWGGPSSVSDATSAGLGRSVTCFVRADGTVACFGANKSGECARDDVDQVRDPSTVAGVADALEVVANGRHTCARTRAGEVFCWGIDGRGQLGSGRVILEPHAIQVQDVTDATDLVATNEATCAIRSGGSVWCWGANAYGNLGGSWPTRARPTQAPGVSGSVGLAMSQWATCSRFADGTARCTGSNRSGQLGTGQTVGTSGFHWLLDTTGMTALSMSDESFACAANAAGLWCWGRNDEAQLGQGAAGADSPMPRNLADVAPGSAAEITTGDAHACVRLNDGSVMCWGRNTEGELAVGDTVPHLSPVRVPNLAGVQTLCAGLRHTCAIICGQRFCWGANDNGQLGDGTTMTRPGPQPVADITTASTIAAGSAHSCAIVAGSVVCWGWDRTGQVSGERAMPNALRPRAVTALPPDGFVQLALGGDHSCARRASGAVWCWGANDSGQLGNGVAQRSAAMRVMGLPAM